MKLPTLPFTDPILVFFTLLAVVLVAPILFQRLRLPGVIGLIVVGVAIGPNGLGWLELEGTITLLGSVGLLYIMFLAGLEIDLNQFQRQKHRSLVFGSITFLIPQVGGTALFLWLGFSWPAALLIASMFASHTLVAYPVITRLGITRNDAVVTAVGGTILTDTAALILLAVIARSVEGELGLTFWATFIGLFALYVAVMALGLPRLGRWFFRRVEDPAAEFLFILAAAFGFSYLARMIGVEPIVGAFFAGLVLNRLVPETSPLMNRVQFVGNALFIPFFLLYIGMLVDLDVLVSEPAAWGVMGAMLATNVVSKLIASRLTQRIFNYSPAEGWVIFGLSTTEAAATLAAALVGLQLGIIDEVVMNGVIMMILVTCLLGPFVVERFGRRVAIQERERPYDPADAPQRVLVPLANPQTADALMSVAYMLRMPGSREAVYPVTVAAAGGRAAAQVAASEKLLGRAMQHAAAASIPAMPITRVDLNVANGIARAALEQRASAIVIGWDGRASLGTRIFGGILDQLLEQTTQEVLVCKLDRPAATHRRIVAVIPPFAGREFGFTELARGLKRMAQEMGTDLVLLAEEEREEPLRRRFGAIRPEVPTTTRTLSDVTDLAATLDGMLRPEDLLVIVSARRGTVSWRPGLDRLPRDAASRFEGNSLIVAYPAVEEPPPDATASDEETAHPDADASPAADQSLTNASEPTR
jgi:Kef-type K+ transport system membrane component KefB/nucleotide-binding universal stress UspA family protein